MRKFNNVQFRGEIMLEQRKLVMRGKVREQAQVSDSEGKSSNC